MAVNESGPPMELTIKLTPPQLALLVRVGKEIQAAAAEADVHPVSCWYHVYVARERLPAEALVNRGILEVRDPWDTPSVKWVRPTALGWERFAMEVW